MGGALLNRRPLAGTLFRAGSATSAGCPSGPLVAAVGLGALLAPMNGSVTAGVETLLRVVQPHLQKREVPAGWGLAFVCAPSALGVVVPPPLILLGGAMMRAHTEAANARRPDGADHRHAGRLPRCSWLPRRCS